MKWSTIVQLAGWTFVFASTGPLTAAVRATEAGTIAGAQTVRTGALKSAADIYGCRSGYNRQSVIRDFVLGQAWIVFANCVHPEMPRVAVAVAVNEPEPGLPRPTAERRRFAAKAVSMVQPGSRVRLWSQDRVARIDLDGVALGGGAPGTPIRVRVPVGGQVLRGIVRGPGSVELAEASGFSGSER